MFFNDKFGFVKGALPSKYYLLTDFNSFDFLGDI